jgi:hypothetical protein
VPAETMLETGYKKEKMQRREWNERDKHSMEFMIIYAHGVWDGHLTRWASVFVS